VLTRDFDQEFAADKPAEFTLCGQTFHARDHVPYSMWRTLMKGDSRVSDDMSPEDVDRMLFADLLDPADLDRFMDTINSPNGNSPKRAQVLAVYAWLMEVASGKARENEGTSSDG
jgi:hypothetical protein